MAPNNYGEGGAVDDCPVRSLLVMANHRRPLTILMSNLVCSMNVRDSLADTPSSGCSSSRRHSEEDYGGEPSQPQLVLQKTGQEMAEAL